MARTKKESYSDEEEEYTYESEDQDMSGPEEENQYSSDASEEDQYPQESEELDERSKVTKGKGRTFRVTKGESIFIPLSSRTHGLPAPRKSKKAIPKVSRGATSLSPTLESSVLWQPTQQKKPSAKKGRGTKSLSPAPESSVVWQPSQSKATPKARQTTKSPPQDPESSVVWQPSQRKATPKARQPTKSPPQDPESTVLWRPLPVAKETESPSLTRGRKRPRADEKETTPAPKRSRVASKSPTRAKSTTKASKETTPTAKPSPPTSRKTTPVSKTPSPASKKKSPVLKKVREEPKETTPRFKSTSPATKTPAKRGRKPKSVDPTPPAPKEGTPATSSAAKPAISGRRGRKKKSLDDSEIDPTPPRVPRSDLEQLGLATWTAPPHVTPATPGHEGWSQAECDLFNHLNDRGAVPLMPVSWQLDFPTFPHALFGEDDEDLLMQPLGSNFRAIKAFQTLLNTGPRIRDCLDDGGDPTQILTKAISAFLKWSRADADLTHAIHAPNIFVGIVGPEADPQAAVDAVDVRVRQAGDQFRVRWGLDPDPAGRKGWFGGLKGGGNRTSKMAAPVAREMTPSSRRSSSIFSSPLQWGRPGTSVPSTPSPKTQVGRPVKKTKAAVKVEAPGIEPPTLYTMIVARSVVSFATYEAAAGHSSYDPITRKSFTTDADDYGTLSDEGRPPPTADMLRSRRFSQGRPTRHIATFSWSDEGQDVWNALAVALLVLVARRWVLRWEAEVGGFPAREDGFEDDGDVDA